MNEAADAEAVTQARAASRSQLPGLPMIALVVRALARIWVVLLLLAGAAFAGVAVTQVFQKRAELEELRREPGASAYAVVAYRAELERQIEAMNADRRMDAVPAPPSRPALMEEIDLARTRNAALRQRAATESLGGISAPP
jgi:hypothetical protein